MPGIRYQSGKETTTSTGQEKQETDISGITYGINSTSMLLSLSYRLK